MMSDKELNELQSRLEQELIDRAGVDIIPLAEAASNEKQDVAASVTSGYRELDDCMKGGFREGDFTVITGIPGEGKTTLARMFTLNFAAKGIPCLWFSHEMTNTELWESFNEMGANTDLLAFVPETLENDLNWMFKHIDKAIAERGIKAVFIDTIGDVVKTDNAREIPNYSTLLEHICKGIRDHGVKNRYSTFVIAHATKQTRSNTNETTNADIAHSNGIPATATNIFHVWRDNSEDNKSYVKIGKSRRDGTKKNWKFGMRFTDGKLLMEGRHEDVAGEAGWRSR